jgi:polysaccharide pyruvyl transferase WcaK-like protein
MKIIITHGYTDLNKGDAAIALGTIAALQQLWPAAEIKSHSNYSEDHRNFREHTSLMRANGHSVVEGAMPSPHFDDHASGLMSNLEAVIRLGVELVCLVIIGLIPACQFLHPRKARALMDLKQADLVVVRGGQYLHNESGRWRGLLFLGRMLLNIAIPIWLETPTVIWGLSIGPVHGRLATWGLYQTVRRCQRIIVRERFSAEYLHQLGLTQNVEVAPDLAFLTLPAAKTRVDDLLPPEPRIAVTVMNWDFPGHSDPGRALQQYLDAIVCVLVDAYQKHRLSPVLVQQVMTEHHGQHDKGIIQELARRLESVQIPNLILEADLSPAELCGLYAQCQVSLASRLHAIIFAACAGTPSIGIRYQGFKTQGIMAELGLADFVHDIAALDAAQLSRSLEELLQRRDSYHTVLGERVSEFRKAIAVVAETKLASLFPASP